MGFYDANYNITKLRTSHGQISELELNGQKVPLAIVTQDNKEVTINVPEYTTSVEITPSSGYEAMKKVIVSLTDIPGADNLYAWKKAANSYLYTKELYNAGAVGISILTGNPLVKADTAEFEFINNDVWTLGDKYYSESMDEIPSPLGTPGTAVTVMNSVYIAPEDTVNLTPGAWYYEGDLPSSSLHFFSVTGTLTKTPGSLTGTEITNGSAAYNELQQHFNAHDFKPLQYVPYTEGVISYNSNTYHRDSSKDITL